MELDAVQAALQELKKRVGLVVVEGLVEDFPALVDDPNYPRPLTHEQPPGPIPRRSDVDRIDEPAGHFDEVDRHVLRQLPAGKGGVAFGWRRLADGGGGD